MTHVLDLFSLKGKVAVVTGAAGLLGAEFCKALAQAGAGVVVADLNVEGAGALAESLTDQGLSSYPVALNVTDPDSVRQLVETTQDIFGRLDILVNSAALDPKFDPTHIDTSGGVGAFETYPLEEWNQSLNVNLTGIFLCCQAAVQPMLNQGQGVIINISSTYGLVGPDQRIYKRVDKPPQFKPAYYPVTKAGIIGLTRYLATYYSKKNIRVNTLTPGGVYNGHDSVFVQAYSARTVLGRMAERDEMSGALLFLASDASNYMTGANLIVDGGWTAW